MTEPEQYSYPQASHTGIVLLNPNSAGHQNVACVLGAYCSNYRVLQKERKKVKAIFVMKLGSNDYFEDKLLFLILIHLLRQL